MRLRKIDQPASTRALIEKVAEIAPTEKPIESASERPPAKDQAGSRNADGLTPKQEAFVHHYLVTMNATEEAKLAALELLAKHLGMFKEQVQHNHEHQHTIMEALLLEIDAEARAARAPRSVTDT